MLLVAHLVGLSGGLVFGWLVCFFTVLLAVRLHSQRCVLKLRKCRGKKSGQMVSIHVTLKLSGL